MKQPLEDFDYSADAPFTGISKATARNLTERYLNECQPALTAIMPQPSTKKDARSIVFPIETLKKFIWEIENSVRNCDDMILGIRMYYAKYPDIAAIKQNTDDPLFADLSNLPDEYSFHHTLVMVPTFKDENNVDHDFDPWEVDDCNVQAIDPSDNSDNSGSSMTSQMNHGNICPPPFQVLDPSNRDQGLSF